MKRDDRDRLRFLWGTIRASKTDPGEALIEFSGVLLRDPSLLKVFLREMKANDNKIDFKALCALTLSEL